MKKITIMVAAALALGGCKQTPQQQAASPYQPLADQYAEFTLTTDVSKLSENEKKMLPILMKAADIMENIFWQNAYGNKQALMDTVTDPYLKKYLAINYGPWDRLNGNTPFIKGIGAKPLGANFYPTDMTTEEFNALQDPRKTDWYSILRRDENGQLKVLSYHEAYPEEVKQASELLKQAAELAEDAGLKNTSDCAPKPC